MPRVKSLVMSLDFPNNGGKGGSCPPPWKRSCPLLPPVAALRGGAWGAFVPPKRCLAPPHLPPQLRPSFIDHFKTFQKAISPKLYEIDENFQGILSRLISVNSRIFKILSLIAPCWQLFKLALPFCVIFQHHSIWRPQA